MKELANPLLKWLKIHGIPLLETATTPLEERGAADANGEGKIERGYGKEKCRGG